MTVIDKDWLTAHGFALAARDARYDYWDGPWSAYSGDGSARHRTRLLYWSDAGFLVEQCYFHLDTDGHDVEDTVRVPGPATRDQGATLLTLFPPDPAPNPLKSSEDPP